MSTRARAGLSMSSRRIGAIFRKELRDYRRNGHIVATMVILPLIFVIPPLINIFALPKQSAIALGHLHPLLYMLGIPALVPAAIAAYAGGRRAPAGHARAGADHADPARGVRGRQGAGGARPVARRLLSGLCAGRRGHRDLRQAGSRLRAAAAARRARPADLHAAAGGLVDLARHRDLDQSHATSGSPSSSACSPICRRSLVTALVAYNVIHPSLELALAARGAAGGAGRDRLADRVADLRPRAPDRGYRYGRPRQAVSRARRRLDVDVADQVKQPGQLVEAPAWASSPCAPAMLTRRVVMPASR